MPKEKAEITHVIRMHTYTARSAAYRDPFYIALEIGTLGQLEENEKKVQEEEHHLNHTK